MDMKALLEHAKAMNREAILLDRFGMYHGAQRLRKYRDESLATARRIERASSGSR